MSAVNWRAVLTYYTLAVAIAAPLRLHWVPILGKYQNFLGGLGPCLAGIFCLLVFQKKHQRINTIFGNSLIFSLLFTMVPLIGFTIVGLPDNVGWSLYACLYIFTYCFLEEMGWRGFLQDALQPLKPVWRYLLLGIMWEAWHLRFLREDLTLGFKLFLLSTTIGGSFGIGKVTETTRSVLTAAWVHMLFNILFEIEMPWQSKILLMVYLIIAWAILFLLWVKYVKKVETPTGSQRSV